MTDLDDARALELFGTTQPPAPRRRLVAGALECMLCDGALQDIRWHGVEVIRGIAYLLRDSDWGTVPAVVDRIDAQESAEAFTVRFTLTMRTADGILIASAHVRGEASGTLTFEVVATPDAAITTNRCGFVLLHPAVVAGRGLRVEHPDGARTDTRFPYEISPSQPVLDIRSLGFSPVAGIEVQCRLDAQLPDGLQGRFEMEDQRNWSDASFKTYVGSLLDPWPYVLAAGHPLTQRVQAEFRGRPETSNQGDWLEERICFGPPDDVRMPDIGLGVPAGLHGARADEVAALRALGASWWMVEFSLDDPFAAQDLACVAAQRKGLPVRIQLDVIAPNALAPAVAASRAAAMCAGCGLDVEAVRMLPAAYLKSYQPSDRWPDLPPLEDYARAMKVYFPHARIGGGMFTSFTELNRRRQSAEALDFIGHLTCPIVHAPDDNSVMQGIEALTHIVHSVRKIWPNLGYRLGPSSISARRNPYGDDCAPNPKLQRVALASADPRHGARFGAAWTVAYAAAVAPYGLEVLALHESHGPRGPLHTGLREAEGAIATWGVLKRLAASSGARRLPLDHLPARTAGVAWTNDGSTVEGLIANLTGEPVRLMWRVAASMDGAEPTTDFTLDALQACSFNARIR